jgi:hypothetical protein
MKTTVKNLWEEFIVEIYNPDLGFEIPLCGLCGNSGIVDTTTTAKWSGKCTGVKKPCICPNGRHKK